MPWISFGRVGLEQERTREDNLPKASASEHGGSQALPYSAAVMSLQHKTDMTVDVLPAKELISASGFPSSLWHSCLGYCTDFLHNYISNVNAPSNDP